ncbi:MAG: PilZ domain-containing protein [Bryobacteraceae bacterium]|jgi:hypothetical protein
MKTASAVQYNAVRRLKTDQSFMGLPPPVERRKFERLPLQLSLQFRRAFRRDEVIGCITENISGEGIYFVSLHSLIAGERLEIDMLLPPLVSGNSRVNVHLRCRAQVVRVESTRRGLGQGIACRIEKYTIQFGDADLLSDQMFKSAKA